MELVNEYNWLPLTKIIGNLDDERKTYDIDKITVTLNNFLKNQDSGCNCYEDEKRFQFHY